MTDFKWFARSSAIAIIVAYIVIPNDSSSMFSFGTWVGIIFMLYGRKRKETQS